MATHSNILSWEIPWTEKPGEPQSTGSQRVHHHQNVHNIKFTILTIFKHLIQWHWVHLQCYATPLTSTCRTFHLPKQRPWLPSLFPQLLVTTRPVSVPVNLMTLGSSCKWDHAVYLAFCIWPLSLTIRFSRLIHVVTCIRMSFLIKTISYSILWMDHIWFRPPPLGRRWLFLAFGSCEQCCCEQGGQVSGSRPCFQLFRVSTQRWGGWITWPFSAVLF